MSYDIIRVSSVSLISLRSVSNIVYDTGPKDFCVAYIET